jgi:hypothetical protein
VPLNIKYSGGVASSRFSITTINDAAGDHRIPSRGIARFAMLGDRESPVTYKLAFENAPLYLPDDQSTINLATYSLGEALDGTLSLGTTTDHRGITSSDAILLVIDGGTGIPGSGCSLEFDPLAGSERLPVPSAIAGW